MKTRLIPMLLVLLVGALLAAGCGDDDEGGEDTGATAPAQTETQPTDTATEETTPEESGGGAAATVEIPADPGGALKFSEETATAKAGEVTLSMPNESSVPHAIAVRGSGLDEKGETVQQGGTSEVTAELQAGEYEFYCPVAGHEQAGMKGTLTVE
jgi:plastocyanin